MAKTAADPGFTCGNEAALRTWGWLIPRLEAAGMPVTFIKQALPQISCAGYRGHGLYQSTGGLFERGDEGDPTTLSLNRTLAALLPLARRDGISVAFCDEHLNTIAEAEAIGTFFHESLHAYVWHCGGDRWAYLQQSARSYYRDAPLQDGSRLPDGSDGFDYVGRLIEEAGAEYVGHRAKILWSALDDLRRFAVIDGQLDPPHGGTTEVPFLDLQQPPAGTLYATHSWVSSRRGEGWAEVRWLDGITTHDRRFGYCPTRWVGEPGRSEPLVSAKTTLPIYPPLADYCDGVVLEHRIPHTYDAFKQRYAR